MEKEISMLSDAEQPDIQVGKFERENREDRRTDEEAESD